VRTPLTPVIAGECSALGACPLLPRLFRIDIYHLITAPTSAYETTMARRVQQAWWHRLPPVPGSPTGLTSTTSRRALLGFASYMLLRKCPLHYRLTLPLSSVHAQIKRGTLGN
jgi:hypothetical protein